MSFFHFNHNKTWLCQHRMKVHRDDNGVRNVVNDKLKFNPILNYAHLQNCCK